MSWTYFETGNRISIFPPGITCWPASVAAWPASLNNSQSNPKITRRILRRCCNQGPAICNRRFSSPVVANRRSLISLAKSKLSKGRVRLDEIAVGGVNDVRQTAELESAAGKKFVHFPEEPGAGIERLEENFRVDNANAVEDLRAAREDESLRALQIELQQLDAFQFLPAHQLGQRQRHHADGIRHAQIAGEPL